VLAEAKVASPLIRLEMFRNPVLGAGLATSMLVLTVAMATLVVGPFYLARALGLEPATVGLVMSTGPIFSALSGVPAGRLVDRWSASATSVVGLVAMVLGSVALATLPAMFGIAGYIAALAILTPGYQLFQAANNTTVMTDIHSDQRGVASGLLNLSRNLGGLTGASVMGAVFAFAAGASDITKAHANNVTAGMQATFVVAALLVVGALAIVVGTRAFAPRRSSEVKA
jgi:MFS family permease